MLSDHLGPFNALIITENHEESDTYNSLNAQQKADFEMRKDMDLDNNQLGINTYKGKKSTIFYLSYPVRLALIANAILDKISNGYGTRIITDSNKNPLYKTQTTNENRCL